jgi:hypothetical protein
MPSGPGAASVFKMATAHCKRMGVKGGFKKGSKGDHCRDRVAEGIAKKKGMK